MPDICLQRGIDMQGIEMSGITMRFGEKFALRNVDLTIHEGTIHAIVGENGAGKSTLMNVLSGALIPTEGTVRIDSEEAALRSPQDANRCGIGMVYQHFMLVQHLRVWQNIILGIEPANRIGTINKKQALEWIEDACETYGMQIDPEQETGKLTVGEQQRVEILKVMVRNARYVIFDEPTAVLTPSEIQLLLENIRSLKRMGKTIIFISHKLEEVFEIADAVTVLRLGEKIATIDPKKVSADELITMMVGRKVKIDGCPVSHEAGDVVLSVEHVSTARSSFSAGIQDVSLDVRAGEIVGIAGVDGNGQTELVDAVLGFEPILSGCIKKNGIVLSKLDPPEIRNHGIALIPPDRQSQGLVMASSIVRNTILGVEDHKQLCRRGMLSLKNVAETTGNLVKKYDVRIPSLEATASELSGGNQQKLILAREFGLRSSDLAIAVNPTRGLDVGAIEFVYSEIEKQKCAGKAILLVSTELSEIMRLSDRIAVFFKGTCMGILNREDADVEQIGRMMMGLKKEEIRQ